MEWEKIQVEYPLKSNLKDEHLFKNYYLIVKLSQPRGESHEELKTRETNGIISIESN
jgi:hypothetical protein